MKNKTNKSDVDVIYGEIKSYPYHLKDENGISIEDNIRDLANSILSKLKENRKEIVLAKGKVKVDPDKSPIGNHHYVDFNKDLGKVIGSLNKEYANEEYFFAGKIITIKAVIEGEKT